MSESGFSVFPAQVADAAQTYAGHQQTAPALGGQVQATGAVNTGDAGLDSLVQQVMNDVAQVCVQVGKALSTTAAALNEVAAGYPTTDATVAGYFTSLMSSVDGANIPMM